MSALVFAWPDGTWAFEHEVYKPEPGYIVVRLPDWLDESLIQEFVDRELKKHVQA